jgi:ParB-like chromosome segregation protein Spo0J
MAESIIEKGNPASAGRTKKDKGRKAVEKKANALGKLAVTYVPTGDMKPNAYNPNRQSQDDFELLLRSMEEDGFTQPIVALPDNTIVDGEHRWRAARELGYTEVPVVHVNMTPEQMRIATLRHNRARGSEDYDLATQVLKDLQELGALDWAQDSLMLDDAEINRLLNDMPAPESLAGDEFSGAWEPGERPEQEAEGVTEGGAAIRVSTTPAAADALREEERRLAAAVTEEERAAARRDLNIFRLSLVFSGEEATIVKGALGDTPAHTILQWCKDSTNGS